ncbi:MAG: serine/threonine protein kinase [Cyanobacteria bacterium]|nr:serine/threonine protein kinase [Cyanobacteria bacterium CG_2015-16_32_12]NCO79607.1 serine/threonine protein kinase [Cyanobacteria bacterium CG_2015-22_32_23]NCS85539.1 serine/threonine protein kinase [Cyanobacteria bacterium CG_2015-02_32_10]
MNKGDLSREKLLVQRYQLKEVIGEGAMGIVYRAEDTVSKKQNVAVKILSKALDDMKMIQRFQREATISALLSERSENIVKVSDYGVDENKVPFYVMEFLNGENLGDMIDIHDISLTQFFEFAHQICRAMETAHNGIFFEGEMCPVIHRDLKPNNIYVTEDATGKQAIKVLDFGIAKLMKNDEGDAEKFMGTPRYCSPEQLQGNDLDNRSDIYSLGMVMYLMLSKKYPWDLEINSVGAWYKAHTELLPAKFSPELNIPLELEKLILCCLEKSPFNRPQSVGEIIQKLENIARKIFVKNNNQVENKTAFNVHEIEENKTSSLENFLLTNKWPINKPIQKIVFPRIITHEEQVIPTICTMLEEEDINNRKNNIRYNQFLFQSYPHPMILWLTVLYSLEDGARWLPCYLDLKTKIGQQVVNILSDSKEYFLLFFPLEKPHKCHDLLSFKIMLKQRTSLKKWSSVGNMLSVKHNEEAIVSRRKLKQDLEELKPKIILEIEKSHTQEIHG